MRTNSAEEAISALAGHAGYSPVITWDGVGPYCVQPDPGLVPIDDGHVVILTREELADWLDAEASTITDEHVRLAAEWLEHNRGRWFESVSRSEAH